MKNSKLLLLSILSIILMSASGAQEKPVSNGIDFRYIAIKNEYALVDYYKTGSASLFSDLTHNSISTTPFLNHPIFRRTRRAYCKNEWHDDLHVHDVDYIDMKKIYINANTAFCCSSYLASTKTPKFIITAPQLSSGMGSHVEYYYLIKTIPTSNTGPIMTFTLNL